MGILKAISDAVKEKAKEEIIRYLKKVAEENGSRPAQPRDRQPERPDRHAEPRRDERPYPPKERQERTDRPERSDRNDRYDRPERQDRQDPPRSDRRPDQFERPPHRDRTEYTDRNDRQGPQNTLYPPRNDRNEATQEHRGWDRDRDNDRNRDRDRDRGEKERPHQQQPQQRPAVQPETRPPAPVEQKKPEPPVAVAPTPPAPAKPAQKPAPVKEEWIAPLNEEPIEKIQVTTITQDITIPHDFARTLQPLPLNEYTLYLKMYLYAFSVHKNYGYIGAGLRKSVGLDEMSPEDFTRLLDRLCKRGLALIEKISEYQSTYTLYLPFDPEIMKKIDEKKKDEAEEEPEKEVRAKERPAAKPHPQKQAPQPAGGKGQPAKKKEDPQPQKGRSDGRGAKKGKEPEKKQPPKGRGRPAVKEQPAPADEPEEPMIPGRTAIHMDEDGLMKAYRTFVSMEIDKAKMRVGRSNFDKIYMEAVKYIDKKHGFKVLSDQERFREYLTQYYISAFDIPDFEAWKKTKG